MRGDPQRDSSVYSKKEHAQVQEKYLGASKELFKKIIFSEELDSYFTDFISRDDVIG